MNTAILSEVRFFVSSFIWGALLFILYDCLIIFRNIIRHKKLIIAVQDIIFWVVAGFYVFRMIYLLNHGTIRWYSIAGLILGMYLYNSLLSVQIIDFFTKIIKKMIQAVKSLLLIIFRPIHFLLCKIKILFKFIGKKCKIVINYMTLFFKKQLKKRKEKVKIKKEKKKADQTKEQMQISEHSSAKSDASKEQKPIKGSFELIRKQEEEGDKVARKKEEKKNRS